MQRFVAVALATTLLTAALPQRAAAIEPSRSPDAAGTLLHVVFGDKPSQDDAPLPLRNAGSVEGQVMGVDYKTGLINLQTPRGRYDVLVLPSTNIQGEKPGFRTIADIARGAKVQIMMSQRGSQYIAQMIRLR